MLGAGDRNKNVQVFNVAYTVDSSGNRIKVLTTYGTLHCQLKPVSTPREQEISKTFSEISSHILTILYNPNINHQQIGIINGVTYSFIGVSHEAMNKETYIYCNRLTNNVAPPIVDASTLPTNHLAVFDAYGTVIPSQYLVTSLSSSSTSSYNDSGIRSSLSALTLDNLSLHSSVSALTLDNLSLHSSVSSIHQSPWNLNIDANNFKLYDINNITFGGGVSTLPTWSGNPEMVNEQYVCMHFRGGFQFDGSAQVGNIDYPDVFHIQLHTVSVNNGSFLTRVVSSNSTEGSNVDTDASWANQTNIDADSSFQINNPTNGNDGQKYIWKIKNIGGDTISITLDNQFRFGSQVTNINDIQSGETAYIHCLCNGEDSMWDVLSNPNGYIDASFQYDMMQNRSHSSIGNGLQHA